MKITDVRNAEIKGHRYSNYVRPSCDSHAGKDFAPAAYGERAPDVVTLGCDALKLDVDEARAGFRSDPWNWHASDTELERSIRWQRWHVELFSAPSTSR